MMRESHISGGGLRDGGGWFGSRRWNKPASLFPLGLSVVSVKGAHDHVTEDVCVLTRYATGVRQGNSVLLGISRVPCATR